MEFLSTNPCHYSYTSHILPIQRKTSTFCADKSGKTTHLRFMTLKFSCISILWMPRNWVICSLQFSSSSWLLKYQPTWSINVQDMKVTHNEKYNSTQENTVPTLLVSANLDRNNCSTSPTSSWSLSTNTILIRTTTCFSCILQQQLAVKLWTYSPPKGERQNLVKKYTYLVQETFLSHNIHPRTKPFNRMSNKTMTTTMWTMQIDKKPH